MLGRSHLALAISVLIALVPSVAAAQASTGELRDEDYRHRIAGELTIFHRGTSGGSSVALQPGVHAAIGIVQSATGPSVQLDLSWRGGAYVSDPVTGETRAALRMFNPFIGARGALSGGERGSRWRARFGGGLTLPLANAYDPDVDILSTLFAAGALTGMWDPWLHSVANLAVVLRADFEYRHQFFFVGAETALGFMLPVEWQGRTGDTLVAPQLGIWAAGRPIEQLALGLRFQAVAVVTTADLRPGEPGAEGYLALAPFVRLELDPAFLEARWLLNLDDPLGPALDDNRYWGFYLGGGAQF